jgi:hypothetical protein
VKQFEKMGVDLASKITTVFFLDNVMRLTAKTGPGIDTEEELLANQNKDEV